MVSVIMVSKSDQQQPPKTASGSQTTNSSTNPPSSKQLQQSAPLSQHLAAPQASSPLLLRCDDPNNIQKL
ncbi:hypothetical protein LB505_011453 [Fusarium chuoi]|nr:hypothetical protein LB505_011453 [Fusarium chuoi]